MAREYEIVDVSPENVEEYDLLCKKSKKNSEGYQNKLNWFIERYSEGLRIKILLVNDRGKMTSRGFIEYVPGEFAWRAVSASDYMVIHCLWVVGKWKNRGYGTKLVEMCVEAAQREGAAGVAMVTSKRTWLADKEILMKEGFEVVDTAPPCFELVIKRFKDVPDPRFPTNWEKRQNRYGSGLTVLYSGQCPYQPDAVKSLLETAKDEGINARAIELKNAREVQENAPSAYGVFNIVYNGKLLSYTYLARKDLLKKLREVM